MKAFHGNPEIKETYLMRVRDHRAADELVKGKYWEGGKGCAVGCTIHGSQHSAYEELLGIPRILAKLEDRIFEGLPNNLAMSWPESFLDAIPVGKYLSKIWPKFAIFLLTDSTQCASRHPQCDVIANKFREELDGAIIDWRAAYAAAAAAYAAAYAAAAYAAAAGDAYAAAYAAAAGDAGDAGAGAGAAGAGDAYIAQSRKLLELLRENP